MRTHTLSMEEIKCFSNFYSMDQRIRLDKQVGLLLFNFNWNSRRAEVSAQLNDKWLEFCCSRSCEFISLN